VSSSTIIGYNSYRDNIFSLSSGERYRGLFLAHPGGSAPSGYVDFKFISLPLAIVRIDCTIVRVIEPQRLLVVLRNGILKSVFNLT